MVQTYRDLVRHPQAEAVGVFSWLQQAGANDPWPVPNIPGMPAFEPGSALAQSPTVGEHTRQILEELGYGADEIDGFYADGVVA